MDNLQHLNNSQCGELERLAAAAATMDYTASVSPVQTSNQNLQENNNRSIGQAIPHINHDEMHPSRSTSTSSMPQVISYIDPFHLPKGHHLIPIRTYETQSYVQDQPQSMSPLAASPRVVMLATNNSHSTTGVQFTRPVTTHFTLTGIQYQNDQISSENCVQASSYPQLIATPNTQIIQYSGPSNSNMGEPSTVQFVAETSEQPVKSEPPSAMKDCKKRCKYKEEEVEVEEETLISDESKDVKENSVAQKKEFTCETCSTVLESKETLKEHQLQHNNPKRNGLALELKIEIIKRINSGERKADMADEYGVNASTIKSIMKKADSYLSCWKKGMFNPDSTRLKGPKRKDIEEALYSWYKQAIENDAPVSGSILCNKALDFAKKLGHTDFKTTHGWLDRFKKRKKIVFGRGASKRRREDKAHECVSSILPQMLIDYEPTDIFAVELLGLFYRALPSAVDKLKGNKCPGGVKAKERLTVVMCTNMTGSEKFPLLVVGRSRRGFIIKSAKTLPVHYIVDENAWLTSEILSSWLLDMDSWFAQQGRKVIFLAPPSPIYSHPPRLRAIKFVVMPSGYPSPLRQVAVPYFKRFYRKNLLKELMAMPSRGKACPSSFANQIPLFTCLQFLSSAWQSLTDNVIVTSFQRSGLTKYGAWGMIPPIDNTDFAGLQEIFINAIHILDDKPSPETTFESYIHFDDDVQVCNMMGDDDILAKVKGVLEDEEDELSEEEQDKENEEARHTVPKPIFPDVENALGVLRKYIQYQEGAQEMFQVLAHLEYCIFKKLSDAPTANPLVH